MRVIAGKLRHRIIKETNLETTRETQDRIREAIFNSLLVVHGSVLDLFCGSGAMAIEAYSRGANHIVLNDINKQAVLVSKENLELLNIKDYEIFNLDYEHFLKQYLKPFDFIFLDPPYMMNNIYDILIKIINSKIVKSKTKIVFEMASETNYLLPSKIDFIKEKKYGKKKVVFMEVK